MKGKQIFEEGAKMAVTDFYDRRAAGHKLGRQPALEKTIKEIRDYNPLLGDALNKTYGVALGLK